MQTRKHLPIFYLILFFLSLSFPAIANDFTVSDVDDLRQAIQQANGNGQSDVITLSPGTYNITGASHEDGGSTGDLDIRSDLTLKGNSPRDTILLGDGSDRILDIGGAFNVQIENLTIKGGKVTGGTTIEENGGGIFINNGPTVTILNCNITENINDNDFDASGGAIFNMLGTLIIHNSIISKNNAIKTAGGGICQFGGSLELINSTISGNNSLGDGGGILFLGGTSLILNSTITENEATSGGGEGIVNSGTTITMGNSLIVGNIDSNEPNDADFAGTFTSLGGNLIGNNGELAPIKFFTVINQQPSDQIGTANNPIDPMLGPLQNNGGDTDTHALLPGSPALNNGEDANCPSEDQRGVVRPLGGKCDIGAFEEGCGDGTKEPNEECDDNNNIDDDGCSSICKLESINDPNDPSSGGCNLGSQPNHTGFGITLLMALGGFMIFRKLKT